MKKRVYYEKEKFKKLLLTMKMIIILSTVAVFHAMAVNTYSQNTKLSLEANATTIEDVLLEIENMSEFYFLYNNKLVDVSKQVDVKYNNMKINDILTDLFDGESVRYIVLDKQIILSPGSLNAAVEQEYIVKGKVTDTGGEPLPGVNITEKGTTKGTVTDLDGNYTISVSSSNTILSFSYVGYLTEEVTVGGQAVVDVTLIEDITALDEVVVIGYGYSKKSDLTGSVSSIGADDLENHPVIRIEDALKGKAAGIQVQKQNGAPGAGIKIRIRGANSINGSNEPLYVIDGYVGADASSLNPSEIESINILKDASSTAIYGSRGANGVILITTKTAKNGDSKFEFNSFYSIDQISKTYDLLDGAQYMEVINEKKEALGLGTQFKQQEIDAVRASGGTDWQDEIYRNGGTQNYQLAFSGGTEKTQYYLSGSIADQKGIILNSNYKRYGLRTNINSQLRDNFDLAFTMYSTYTESRNNYTQNGRSNTSGTALIFSPNIDVYDEDGNYTESPSYGPIASNPVYQAKERIFDNKGFNTLANIKLNYQIAEGLTLSVSGGGKGNFYDNPYLKTAGPGSSISTTEAGHNNGYSWNLQNTNMLNYARIFADKHNLNVSVIYEQQKYISRYSSSWATGFPTISLGYDNISLGDTRQVGSGYQDWSIQSFLGRLNYTFNEKYLFTGTFRADGSSKFYGDNKYGYFPSGAFAWRMSEEPFIESLNVFQNLKFRASYGLTGSQATGPYKTLSLLSLGQNYSFNGTTNQLTGIGPGVAANPDLKWETTAQTNIGLDIGIFDGRLSGTVDYYYKKTTDLIMDVDIPDYGGGGKITQNVGSLENKGFEFLLSGVLVNNTDFSVNTNFNMSFNRNKVLDLGDEDVIYTNGGYDNWPTGDQPFILEVGKPFGQFRGLVFDGLWKSSEAEEASLYGNSVPGDCRYLDLNGDYSYGADDMVVIGNAQPDFTWGWNTVIEYKNFDLTVFVNGAHGNDVWNQTKYLTIGMGTDVPNPTSVDILNHWTPQNENTDVPGFSSTNNTYAQSSKFVEDGSFIRLNNVTLGYTFPGSILNNTLRNARIYVSGQNLLLITKYSGIDPELSSTPTGTDVALGIDNGTYPAVRTISFGLKVGF